ncbi:MAG: TrkH family potassium uptake protein [Bacteroidales bacterium]
MAEFNARFVSRILGLLLLIEAAFMLLSLFVALLYGGNDVMAFVYSTTITALTGFALSFIGKNHSKELYRREGIFIVATSWFFFSLFGLLPFYLSNSIPSITDSFFETMSGFTTTGATILNNIETLPHGVLFWRSIIQWLGGMGIIVFTLALLPLISSSGGIYLFNFEAPGLTHDKLRPRIDQTAKRLWGMYLVITLIEVLLLWVGPMNLFDAICHSFTTMATGGYSTKQASIAHWNSPYVEYIVSLFMFIAGINFANVYFVSTGRVRKVMKDEEFRWYTGIVLFFTFVVFIGLMVNREYGCDIEQTFRLSLFQVLTAMTSTGFATADYVIWGTFFWVIFMILMLLGGSAGSTSGGIKVVRMIVMIKNTINEFFRNVHPRAIVPVRLNNHVLPFDLVSKVLAFIFLYMAIVLFSIIVLSAFGTGFEESIGGVITCIGNVGPGLGTVGPAGNFSALHPFVKWYLAFIMMIGRLELFTVLTLFTRAFWRK